MSTPYHTKSSGLAYRDGVKREGTRQGWAHFLTWPIVKLPLHTDDVIPILLPGCTYTVIRHNECTSVKSFARFTKATI